ncbi:MAG: hypothetical protein KY464_09935 [Gemmatimonadetes bacterium]|nr:hypothetical protein [Gemmatimonadota bacterium]
MTSQLRVAAILLFAATLGACGTAADETSATVESAEASAGGESSLERFAGDWQVRQFNMVGDSLPTVVIHATADSAGWTAKFPDRDPIPMRVIESSGDLVVTEMGPFPSLLRPGVQVTVQFVNRLQGEELRGHLLAIYDVNGPSAILRGRTQGTRMP